MSLQSRRECAACGGLFELGEEVVLCYTEPMGPTVIGFLAPRHREGKCKVVVIGDLDKEPKQSE